MASDILDQIRDNVIQGRANEDDEGFEDDMVGQPAVSELTKQALDQGIGTADIINALTAGMDIVGQKFEDKEYFIPDMLSSAEAVGVGMELLEPYLAASGIEPKGKVILATVKGDLHDIGKNIVAILLRGAGYIVKDLGNDVDPQSIVAAVKAENPQFLGLSALLTSTMSQMEETVKALEESGSRNKVKVLIGGAPVTEEFAQSIGADGYGADGFQAVRVVESLS